MRITIPAFVFVVSALLLVGFWNQDACLDSGGMSANLGYICTDAGNTFSPVWGRPNILLWVFILTPAGVFAWSAHKLLCKIIRG